MFMKNIVLFVMFFGLNLNAQSLESFGLKGNVKSIQEEYKRCSKSNSDADCFPLSSEMKFSEDGYLLKNKNSLEFDGISREKKESPTGWLETVYREEDSLTIKLAENYYDKKDLMYKTISYDEFGDVFNTTQYFYNDVRMLIRMERNTLNYDGVREKAVSFFNEYGTLCGVEFYLDNKLDEKYEFDIQYKFDETGNWIYYDVDDKFSKTVFTRTITYY